MLRSLKSKYSTDLTIDVADLIPIVSSSDKTDVAASNKHIAAWKNPGKPLGREFEEWFEAANQYWAKKMGIEANVVPVGGIDVRLEAVKLIEEQTKGYQQ